MSDTGHPHAGRVTLALSLAYASVGIFWGMLAIVFPEMLRATDVTPGAASVGLASFSVAALASMAILRPRLGHLSRRAAMRCSIVAFVIGAVLLVLVPNPALMLGFTVAGVAEGVGDVAIHAAANDLEQTSGRPVLQWVHGGYSAGAALGAITGGVGLGLGVSFGWLLVGSGVIPLASVPILAVVPPTIPPRNLGTERVSPPRRATLPPGAGTAIAIAVSALLLEASLELWSATYLRRTLGASVLVGGSLWRRSVSLSLSAAPSRPGCCSGSGTPRPSW